MSHGPNQNGRFSCVGGLEDWRIAGLQDLLVEFSRVYVVVAQRGKKREKKRKSNGIMRL
jgi:hypothetical protein